MLGELAALSAAALWAVASLIFARLGTRDELSPLVMNLLKCTLAGALLWGTMRVTQGVWWPKGLENNALLILGTSGLIGLTVGDTSYFRALVYLGARRGLLMMTLAPLMTAAMAWPVLDEPITPMMALGMAVTLGGVMWVISERTAPHEDETEQNEQSKEDKKALLFGIGLGCLAAFCQASGNVLTKLGGEGLSSVEVSVVRLLFGTAGLMFVVGIQPKLWGQVRQVMGDWRMFRTLFVATLLGTYLGIWLLVTSLQLTKTGIAATLTSMSPIFVLPLVAMVEREKISPRAIFGAVVAVIGVAILSLF